MPCVLPLSAHLLMKFPVELIFNAKQLYSWLIFCFVCSGSLLKNNSLSLLEVDYQGPGLTATYWCSIYNFCFIPHKRRKAWECISDKVTLWSCGDVWQAWLNKKSIRNLNKPMSCGWILLHTNEIQQRSWGMKSWSLALAHKITVEYNVHDMTKGI